MIQIIYYILVVLYYLSPTLSLDSPPKLLILSIDGFCSDYPSRFSDLKLQNFARFSFEGATAPYMVPVFPTKTFPNHQTIATGLYPESHGIVDNKFYDPKLNDTFEPTNSHKHNQWNESKWFSTGAEPIWITNEICSACSFQGISGVNQRISGMYHWPSSNAPYKGISPNPANFVPYEDHINITEAISRVLEWFTRPTNPVNLALLYYHPIDVVGHKNGTDSEDLRKELRILDSGIGYLLDRVNSDSVLREFLNIIIISDHGMQDWKYTPNQGIVYFNKILNESLYTTNDDINFWISPKPGSSICIYLLVRFALDSLFVFRLSHGDLAYTIRTVEDFFNVTNKSFTFR